MQTARLRGLLNQLRGLLNGLCGQTRRIAMQLRRLRGVLHSLRALLRGLSGQRRQLPKHTRRCAAQAIIRANSVKELRTDRMSRDRPVSRSPRARLVFDGANWCDPSLPP